MLRTIATAAAIAFAASLARAAPPPVAFRAVASGFELPLEVVHAGDGSGRLFVVEQGGRIRIVRGTQVNGAPFLDVSGAIVAGGEQGLLGLAFHPAYRTNGRFYVFFNAAAPGSGGTDLVVARYLRSSGDADLADPSSRTDVIRIHHPDFTNHNGGKIAFGPDGYLYIAIGDGGGGGDPNDNAQDLADLRGKLLRIDVDGAAPYAVPPSNPFIATPGARPEVWAYGLRNPFRFNFDRATGDLFIGDVGQNAYEEIDFVAAGSPGGQNFGWRQFEGTHCYNPPTGCFIAGHVPPILEYFHDINGGFAVIGGVRYRGDAFRELRGYYVYGDNLLGNVWAASPDGAGRWTTALVANIPSVAAFGEDEAGEVYAAQLSPGTLWKLGAVDADADGLPDAFESAYFGSATAADPAADSDGDGISNLDEYREGRNPRVKDNDVFGDARLFAMQQYRDFLSREGDAGGVAFWTQQVANGTLARGQVIESFLDSQEFQGAVAPVARLYFAYFRRIPDFGGLAFWIAHLRAGHALAAISDFFAASPEFAATYGALGDAQFVDLVYANVLGRAPDPGGRAHWLGQLQTGALTRGQVMLGFSESPEYRADSANPVYVTMAYAGMLRRAPDPGGFAFWVDFKDRGHSGLALIGGFLGAPEYRARFLP